jgi:hypothetical protein
MKKLTTLLVLTFLLSACDVWNAQPVQPIGNVVPSRTPQIVTSTPIILNPAVLTPVTPTNTATFTPAPPTLLPSPTVTFTPVPPTQTYTSAIIQAVTVDILGCNTSIDITHGMGEVTNAYVTLKNTGNVDLPNTCALLRAIDEGREHPDKKVCVPNLPVGNQVTLKLTVDSTYKVGTMIQVDASSNEVILLRVDQQSCTDIGLFGGAPADIGVVKPIQ